MAEAKCSDEFELRSGMLVVACPPMLLGQELKVGLRWLASEACNWRAEGKMS